MLIPTSMSAASARRQEIVARINGRRGIVLFGAGAFAAEVHPKLKEMGFHLLAVADNDASKSGTLFRGALILPPERAAEQYRDSLWVIAVYTNSGPRRQCERLGVDSVTFAELAWVFPDRLLPYYALERPELVLESMSSIEHAAALWADADSAREFDDQVSWRLTLDYTLLGTARGGTGEYFPSDLAVPRTDEVFVDCGAYQGDTIDWFTQHQGGRFAKIIAIEPDPENAAMMRRRLPEWRRQTEGQIEIYQVALGSARRTETFESTGTVRSQLGAGEHVVQVVPLDELLRAERPTFVKMDIEGAEQEALTGAADTIRRTRPILAVCLYHRPGDLWEVPALISSLVSDYRLYLRRFSDECWETVCYAIPPERQRLSSGRPS